VAGNGFSVLSTDRTRPLDGIGPAASFRQCNALAVDSAGNLLIADTLNNCIRYGVPSLFSLTKVPVDSTIPVDSSLPPKPLYTSYFESNTRKYTYVENMTGVEVLNHPLPPRQPLPTDNTIERDGSISYTDSTLSIGGTNVVWQQWKDIDPISRTNGRAFYYAPSTFEVTWNLPSTSFPAYPPTSLIRPIY